MDEQRLLYIHVGLSSFVRKDIEILEKHFSLSVHEFDLTNKKRLPITLLKQAWMLVRSLRKSNGIVVQFAGYQSYLPTLIARFYKKPCILILGGTDTVNFPSIQYGCFNKKYLRFATRKSLERAAHLIPVSDTLIEYDYTYQPADFPKQGYKFHAPKVKTPVTTVYNGYSSEGWFISSEKEERSFVTVAADLGSRFGVKLKGIDLLLDVAPSFPSCSFYIVGGDKLNQSLPINVIPIGNMPHEDLPSFIAKKQFYLQLSMSEGFPNALCEAMLSGCVPIVSNVGAMPMILGATGYILFTKDVLKLESLITNSLDNYTLDQTEIVRDQIVQHFPLERREKELIACITKVLVGTN